MRDISDNDIKNLLRVKGYGAAFMINVEHLTKGNKQGNDISPMKWAFLKDSCTRTLHFAE